MPKFVYKTPVLVINGVDLSDHCNKATIETEFDEVESTAFGDPFKAYVQGLGDATITLEMQQDHAAGETDATIWPLVSGGTEFLTQIKPTNAAISATNPEYQMTGRIYKYNPMDGAQGELAKTPVEIRNSTSTGLVRDITP